MIKIVTLKTPNVKNFAEARNKILLRYKSKWLFFVDSDEKPTKKLLKEIKNLDFNEEGYKLKRKNYFLGQYVGQDVIVRIGKSSLGSWKRKVHETWDIKKTKTLKNYLIHNTADNLREYIDKINNYSTIHASENKLEGKKSTLFKIVFFPLAKFLITFISSKNVVFSIMQSLHSFLGWTKLYFLQH